VSVLRQHRSVGRDEIVENGNGQGDCVDNELMVECLSLDYRYSDEANKKRVNLNVSLSHFVFCV